MKEYPILNIGREMVQGKNNYLLGESEGFFMDFSFANALLCIRHTDVCPLPADKRDGDKTVPVVKSVPTLVC